MLHSLKKFVRKTINITGYKISRIREDLPVIPPFHDIIEQEFMAIYEKCSPYTMTSLDTMYSLYKAVEYVVNQNVAGDIVECGVYKGGSSMAMALTLMKMGESKRSIYMIPMRGRVGRLIKTSAGMVGRQCKIGLHSNILKILPVGQTIH
jgi:hypothetical protein